MKRLIRLNFRVTFLSVTFVLLLRTLILSETIYTDICSECMDVDVSQICKKCIKFKEKEGTQSFTCERKIIFLTSFTDLCVDCKKNGGHDGFDFMCSRCTEFAAINVSPTPCPTTECPCTLREENINTTNTTTSFLKECTPCPECNLATNVNKEEEAFRTQSPSTFEYTSCPECIPVNATEEAGAEEVTSKAQSPSFECASCPECGPTTIIGKEDTEEKIFRTEIPSSFDMVSSSNKELLNVKDNLLGYMLGAVFGGALFGSIITVVCFMIFRRRTAEQKKREMALDAPQNIADMRVMEQLVQGHSNKNRMTSNEINNEMTKSQKESTQFNTEEGVYNHLNATETIDRDEYYDHARAGAPFKTQSDTNSDDYDHAGPVPSTASQYDGYGV